jgi:DNA-binding CsgD family transcriptional regulator
MRGPVTAGGRDLRTLAGIVSDDRGEPPPEGLAPSLLGDLLGLIRCDLVVFCGTDSSRQVDWFGQTVPIEAHDPEFDEASFRSHYWNSPCSYPERTGDLRRIIQISDFYSARQWHSTGMYQDCCKPYGNEHELTLCLPASPGWTAGPGRTLRLVFIRGPGPDFSGRERDLLTVLRPHLHQAYRDAERRRHPVPKLTARQRELLHLVAAGHTNAQIARRLGISEGTVRTHLGKHLPPAAGLQPDRRRHPRLRRPDGLTPPHPRPGPLRAWPRTQSYSNFGLAVAFGRLRRLSRR